MHPPYPRTDRVPVPVHRHRVARASDLALAVDEVLVLEGEGERGRMEKGGEFELGG
jgi:hypothetical protein